jgi:O-antigen ligase
MVSVSRSGIVGAGAAMLFLLPTWSRQRRYSALMAIVLGAIGIKVLAPGLIHTFVTYFQELFGNANAYATAQARTSDYGYVFQYVSQRPVFGMGFGTFTPELYIFTDNSYLNSLAAVGFVGVATILVLYFSGLHCAAAGRRRTHDEQRRETGQGLVAAIVVGIVASATFDALSFPMFSGLFFLIMGAAAAYLGIMTSESDPSLGSIQPTRSRQSA